MCVCVCVCDIGEESGGEQVEKGREEKVSERVSEGGRAENNRKRKR